MKVTCTLDVGNNEEHPTAEFILEGDPLGESKFINVFVDGKRYEIRPEELYVAVQRVRRS